MASPNSNFVPYASWLLLSSMLLILDRIVYKTSKLSIYAFTLLERRVLESLQMEVTLF
jgi:hypothetical protein